MKADKQFQLTALPDDHCITGYTVTLPATVDLDAFEAWLREHKVAWEYYAQAVARKANLYIIARLMMPGKNYEENAPIIQQLCQTFSIDRYYLTESRYCSSAVDADGSLLAWFDVTDFEDRGDDDEDDE
ncbi:MAG: hypothetical protein LIP02_09150 [Bacteroidales bacterium]|nr:hypothetical protein [Bacteroidales bacterium]